ncbi:MAG: hypothetical protein ABJH05_16410 [Fulvivirga sp.]
MKALYTFISILLLSFNTYAQDGGYFLTHYASGEQEINNINFDIAQDTRGVIYVANRSGIIAFDGTSWEKIKTPASVFTLAFDNNNQLYTGGVNGFGKIGQDSDNYQKFIAVGDSTITDIFDMVLHDNRLVGINSSTVFTLDLSLGKTSRIKSEYSGELLNVTLIKNEVFVTTEISGFKKVGDTSLESPGISSLEEKNVEFIAEGPDNAYLIGFANNSISILKGGEETPIELEDNYLSSSIIIDGVWISDTLIAIATLRGGVAFINPNKGEINQVVNYANGLPDNEIFAISLDQHRGLWVAHNEGLTRISPNFPFRAFDRYDGLEGDMLSVQYHNDKLYVGTSLGVYYLSQVKEYDEKKVFEAKTIVSQVKQEKERKGLFGFLKRNEEESAPKRTTRYVTRIERELQSVRYEYKKIVGINSKVFALKSIGGQLYSSGLDGLFAISDTTATTITQSPVRTFHASTSNKKIFVNTYNDRFEVFETTSGDYQKLTLFSDFHDWVSYIFEDHESRIWFCSSNDIYYIKLNGSEIVDTEEFEINNPFFYNTYGIAYNDSLYFVNESGTYKLNETAKRLMLIDSAEVKRYTRDNNGTIWILRNNAWTTLGSNFESEQLDVLSVFTDINHISYDSEKKDFWVLTRSKNLYRFDSQHESSRTIASYDLFLKNIRTTNKIFLPEPKLKFKQENSSLIFEFVQPEYSGVLNIEYQYKLEGLSDSWSEWSPSYNIIPIPYLPDGKYKMHMRSRNVISGIKTTEPIAFEVIPPYWKRPWFLAFEFSGLALLLFLTVRLKKLGYKYRMLSRLLALLTLIIIIEFIQTVAENEFGTESSPVVDFIIQITVAIIILPVEGLIRKYVFKEKNVQILDFITLKGNK